MVIVSRIGPVPHGQSPCLRPARPSAPVCRPSGDCAQRNHGRQPIIRRFRLLSSRDRSCRRVCDCPNPIQARSHESGSSIPDDAPGPLTLASWRLTSAWLQRLEVSAALCKVFNSIDSQSFACRPRVSPSTRPLAATHRIQGRVSGTADQSPVRDQSLTVTAKIRKAVWGTWGPYSSNPSHPAKSPNPVHPES